MADEGSTQGPAAPLATAPAPEGEPGEAPPAVSVAIVPAEAPEAAPGRIRVALVDDHVVVRQGLASLLRQQKHIQIVGEASDGESAVELIRRLRPDVVLMDVTMPGIGGIEATRIAHAECPEVRIIGLSMHDDSDVGRQMRQAGAVAYVAKSGPSDAILNAILACHPPCSPE